MPSNELVFDIAIIGAGISGVSTALHLLVNHQYDGNVCLLDARDRIGGRIHHADIAGDRAQLGANWIHGIVGNPIYTMACELGLVSSLLNEESDSVYYGNPTVSAQTTNGTPLPLSLVKSCADTYFRMMKQCEMFPPRELSSDSLGEQLRQMINSHLSSKVPESERSMQAALFEQMLQRECNINGCAEIEDVSLSGYGAYEQLPGGNLVIKGGFSELLKRMLDLVIKKSNEKHFQLLLSHEVQKIQWGGIQEETNSVPTLVRLKCSNDVTIIAKHVVCTIPVGVLKKKAAQLFEPTLPLYKMSAIEGIGLDVVNKLLIEFESSLCPHFWDAMVDELITVNIHRFGPKRQLAPGERMSEYEKPDYDLSRDWTSKIYSYQRLNNRLLLGWVYGKEARQAETMNQEQLKDAITEHLVRLSGHRDFPRPKRVLVTQWGSDEFACGSYSFIKAGGKASYFDELAEPIFANPAHDKPILLFAGEACHNSFFSTTHGAFLSGKKAASYLRDSEKPSPDTA